MTFRSPVEHGHDTADAAASNEKDPLDLATSLSRQSQYTNKHYVRTRWPALKPIMISIDPDPVRVVYVVLGDKETIEKINWQIWMPVDLIGQTVQTEMTPLEFSEFLSILTDNRELFLTTRNKHAVPLSVYNAFQTHFGMTFVPRRTVNVVSRLAVHVQYDFDVDIQTAAKLVTLVLFGDSTFAQMLSTAFLTRNVDFNDQIVDLMYEKCELLGTEAHRTARAALKEPRDDTVVYVDPKDPRKRPGAIAAYVLARAGRTNVFVPKMSAIDNIYYMYALSTHVDTLYAIEPQTQLRVLYGTGLVSYGTKIETGLTLGDTLAKNFDSYAQLCLLARLGL